MMVIHDTTSQKGIAQTKINNLVAKHNFYNVHYFSIRHFNTKHFAADQKFVSHQNPLLLKPLLFI